MSRSVNDIVYEERRPQGGTMFLRWFLVLVYAGCIFAVSATPGNALPALGVNDKLLHAAEFGTLAFLLCRAVGVHIRSHYIAMMVSVLVAILYGAVDEAHQFLVAQRVTDVADFAADSIGATLAGWCWLKVGTRWAWFR